MGIARENWIYYAMAISGMKDKRKSEDRTTGWDVYGLERKGLPYRYGVQVQGGGAREEGSNKQEKGKRKK